MRTVLLRLAPITVPLALAALAVLSCSSDSTASGTEPASVTQTIGPEGGTIVVQGAKVTFPKGALAASKEITISASDGPAPDGFIALSKVFTCEPSGTDFAQGVSMQMPFSDDGGQKTMFWSSGADPTFKDVGGESADGKTMVATVRHFSSGFVGRKK